MTAYFGRCGRGWTRDAERPYMSLGRDQVSIVFLSLYFLKII